MSPLSMQALPAAPESLCIVEMGGTEAKEETGEVGTVGGLFLNTGLQVNNTSILEGLIENCKTEHVRIQATLYKFKVKGICYLHR